MSNDTADRETVELTIALPDDWHVHLRDDDMLAAVASYSAERFGRALVMPNLVPPISSSAAARAYRQRILGAVDNHPSFEPKLALYLTEALDPQDMVRGHSSGDVFAVKYYPAGATTNSEQGGTSMLSYRSVLEAMTEHGIPLLVHAEAVDESLDIFDREAAFLERELEPVCVAYPDLRITVEHLSTAAGVDLVKHFPNTHGSITPHHLSCDRSDLLANGMRPHLYCKPVINSRANRDALRAAATSGDERFFLGTDSAPHPLSTKEAEVARAGIFNAPYAVEVVAEVFYEENSLDQLEHFISLNGARHYGLRENEQAIRLTRRLASNTPGSFDRKQQPMPADIVTTPAGVEVRLFGIAEASVWTIEAVLP